MAPQGIRLIAGLGNPGPDYEATRHNAGFWFVDAVATRNRGEFRPEPKFQGLLCRLEIAGCDVRLLKPATYMNRSGHSLGAVIRYFDIPPDQVLVAHDELDLPAGSLRLKWGGGHAGHNGLRDILSVLGTRDFWRLRIGIGHPGDKGKVVDYVLGRAGKDDEAHIREALDAAELCLGEMIAGDPQRVMNRLHGAR